MLGAVDDAAAGQRRGRGRPPTRPDGVLYRALRWRGVHPSVLAAQCGVSQSLVRAWDQGTYRPPDRHAATIAALVGPEAARKVYEATGPAPAAGRPPSAVTRRKRYSWTAADLRRRGHEALAREVEAAAEGERDGPRSAAA